MDDNVGKFFMEDGMLRERGAVTELGSFQGAMVYDVIRIIQGVPLFFEDHYTRTCLSLQAIGSTWVPEASELKRQVHEIVNSNENLNCNIKFIMFTIKGTLKTLGYISRSHYPSEEEIKKGVAVGLFPLERENPNIKIVDKNYKDKINKIKNDNEFFEVFLVDSEGNVNEGGTSNIFFIKKGKIYTAPDEKVLKGITRMHILEVCREAGYEVVETEIPADEIGEAEAVFLSGTSLKVLPVSLIDHISYRSAGHPIIEVIRKGYDLKIERYLMTI